MRWRSSASAVASCDAVVDAEHLGRIGLDRVHVVAGAPQHLDRVGQVVLALHVLGAEAAQRGREQVAAEAVDRRVDLVDRALLVATRRPARRCDRRGRASRAARARSRRRRPGAVVRIVAAASETRCSVASAASVSGRSSGVSPGTHDEVVFGVEIVEHARAERDAHRLAGAARRALLDELDRQLGRELLLQRLRDPLGTVTRPRRRSVRAAARTARRRRGAASGVRRADAAPSASSNACAFLRRRRARLR